MLTDFSTSFNYELSSKFEIKSLLNIPPHLKCVAILPCGIFVFKKLPCLRTGCSKQQCKTQSLKKVIEKYLLV